jgi:tripartite-type tricarboxylate transporter receptor subunit TctC
MKAVLADKGVQEKMLNAGVITSYQNGRDMAARVESDRQITQALFRQ